MQRHKILTLTQTYLTLSLAEICAEAGLAGTTEGGGDAVRHDLGGGNQGGGDVR